MKAIEATNITKSYGNTAALQGVSLSVERGELFGIIGADGAGKTSLLRVLTSLLIPEQGEAAVEGLDAVRDYKLLRSRIGYMPGRFSLYGDLSVEENLRFFASVFGTSIEENYSLIKDIYSHIEPFKERRAAKLSGGMKQKLALCCALIHSPSVLFLDEPTTGVDPTSRREFWQMLRRLKERGITILVTTPYMDEATLCDRIALMQQGRFLRTDTPGNIVESFGEPLWAASARDMYRLLLDIRAYTGVKQCYTFGIEHHFTTTGLNLEQLIAYLLQRNHTNVYIHPVRPTVEDCYMQLEQR